MDTEATYQIEGVIISTLPIEVKWTTVPLQFTSQLEITVSLPSHYPDTRWKQSRLRKELEMSMNTYGKTLQEAQSSTKLIIGTIRSLLTKDYPSDQLSLMHQCIVEQCQLMEKKKRTIQERKKVESELEEIQNHFDKIMWSKPDDITLINDMMAQIKRQKEILYRCHKSLLVQEEDYQEWYDSIDKESKIVSLNYYRKNHHVINIDRIDIYDHPILFPEERRLMMALPHLLIKEVVRLYMEKDSDAIERDNLSVRIDSKLVNHVSIERMVATNPWKHHLEKMYYEKPV